LLLRISHYTETSEVTENSTIPTHHRTCKASILCMKTPTITTKQTSIVSCRRCRILLLLWDEGLCRRLKSCLSRSRRRVCERCLRKRWYVLVRAGLSVVRSPARLPLRSAVPKSAAARLRSSNRRPLSRLRDCSVVVVVPIVVAGPLAVSVGATLPTASNPHPEPRRRGVDVPVRAREHTFGESLHTVFSNQLL